MDIHMKLWTIRFYLIWELGCIRSFNVFIHMWRCEEWPCTWWLISFKGHFFVNNLDVVLARNMYTKYQDSSSCSFWQDKFIFFTLEPYTENVLLVAMFSDRSKFYWPNLFVWLLKLQMMFGWIRAGSFKGNVNKVSPKVWRITCSPWA